MPFNHDWETRHFDHLYSIRKITVTCNLYSSNVSPREREFLSWTTHQWAYSIDIHALVLRDKMVPIKLKDKVYKTVIKPTMTYVAECWAVRKKDENSLHVAETRMLRWIRGTTRKDHVRNQIIQEDAKVCQMSTSLRQKRLHWYGHVKRRDGDNISRQMMNIVVPGKRRKGRPRLRWTDNNREDMTKYELTADMTENRQYWKMMVKTGPRRSGDGL